MKSLTVAILDFSTLSGTNLQMLTPKRYVKHPGFFYMGVPPGNASFDCVFNIKVKCQPLSCPTPISAGTHKG